jgi:hypothetical protein
VLLEGAELAAQAVELAVDVAEPAGEGLQLVRVLGALDAVCERADPALEAQTLALEL